MKPEDRRLLKIGVAVGSVVLLDDALRSNGYTWGDFVRAFIAGGAQQSGQQGSETKPEPSYFAPAPTVEPKLPPCPKCGQPTWWLDKYCMAVGCGFMLKAREIGPRQLNPARQLKPARVIEVKPEPKKREHKKRGGRKPEALGKDTKAQLKDYCESRLKGYSHDAALEKAARPYRSRKNPKLTIGRKVKKYLDGGSDLEALQRFLDRLDFS
jgi:hypothetical protein